jgi:hypothetical protein
MTVPIAVPVDANGRNVQGYDPLVHAPAVPVVSNSVLDTQTGVRYGAKSVSLSASNFAVPAGAATTVGKASSGVIATIVCTSSGATAATTFYDNASAGSGTILYLTKTTPAQGDIYQINGAALNGITAVGVAGSAAFTVYYS